MTRIAAIYDIHGNLPALEAVLDEIRAERVDRVVGGTRIVNAGSVGMPVGGPGANWLLPGSGLEPRRTCYDLSDASRRILASGFPGAKGFAENCVLNPPAESVMLDAIGKAELTQTG